jgi:hypothetical protein
VVWRECGGGTFIMMEAISTLTIHSLYTHYTPTVHSLYTLCTLSVRTFIMMETISTIGRNCIGCFRVFTSAIAVATYSECIVSVQ